MLAAYAAELQALKLELQSTLARLEQVGHASESDLDVSQSLDASSVAETAPTTVASPVPHRPRRSSHTNRPVTAWSRRRLVQELAAASSRRRQVEMQIQRQQGQVTHGHSHERRREAVQMAIQELQQQRADILRQIQQDTAAEEVPEQQGAEETIVPTQQSNPETDPPPAPANSESVSETQYSIGGVVTLEPLSLQQQDSATSSRSGVSFRHLVPAAPSSAPVLEEYPRLHYRHSPDALNDVFSLQVKFAETMLKLEKSVQMRDYLLHHGGVLPKRKVSTRTESRVRHRRHHSFESGSNSDTSVIYRERRNSNSSSVSSSSYSFSSLDSTPQRSRRAPMRYQNFQASRATTAETAVPSSNSADTSPGIVGTANAAALVSFTPSSRQEADSFDEDEAANETEGEHPAEHQSTPTTGSSVTTPTTGSDQKSNTSSSKQVRFGDDAYSTPVLKRKFNFDNPSIDEDDDEPAETEEEEEEEAESLLSFLGGSSVTSTELNDASFVQAFERFRSELRVAKHDGGTPEPALARELLPVEKTEEEREIPADRTESTADTTVATEAQEQASRFPQLDALNMDELQTRRRQLCLDIQGESARLVLRFGARQSANFDSRDAESTRTRLLALRDELYAIDTRLKELQ